MVLVQKPLKFSNNRIKPVLKINMSINKIWIYPCLLDLPVHQAVLLAWWPGCRFFPLMFSNPGQSAPIIFKHYVYCFPVLMYYLITFFADFFISHSIYDEFLENKRISIVRTIFQQFKIFFFLFGFAVFFNVSKIF